MAHQEQNPRVLKDSDEFGETNKSPPSTNTTYHSFSNLDTSQSNFEHNGLNRDISDPVKYFDFQRLLINQENTTVALKMSEYEKALIERDNTIKSLHTNMMNSQNNNYVLTNQCKNIMEKTKSVSDTCQRLHTSFTSICDHLNKLGDTVDNAKTRQKDVISLVDQTTNTFQEKILNISDKINDSIKQVNIEKIREKQELEALESRYSLDLIAYKANFKECTKEIENLKIENNLLLEKLNETNIKLNEEKKNVYCHSQNYEKVLENMEGQNVLLISQNKSLNVKYDEILNENQLLKDEISVMKISMYENIKQLDKQSTIIKEQTELLDNLKISEELNNVLKKDNFSLKEHNKYLEKTNVSLIEDISKNKVFQNKIQEEKENEFNDMCKNYDDLLKIQEENLLKINEKLQLQSEKECKIQAEVIDLKEVVEKSNKTILNLQEEINNNNILIPELKNKIADLSTNLGNAYKKLQDSDSKNTTEMDKLKNEKFELENQSKEHFKQIEKLTANYMKYKSKAKQLYVEIMRLRFQCSQLEKKNTPRQPSPKLEAIEISSDEDKKMKDDDVSIFENNNKDVSNMNISITSNEMNQMYNNTSYKRSSSPLRQISNANVKKRKASVDNLSSKISTISTKGLKQKIDFQQIEGSLNSSFKSINLKHEDQNANEMKILLHNKNAWPTATCKKRSSKKNKSPVIMYLVNTEKDQKLQKKDIKSTTREEKCEVNDKSKNQVKSMSNISSNKKFKIPADMKSSQVRIKSKPKNMGNID